jgi:hypothetical protein
MSPGWAFLKGCILNVDVISTYGIGVPGLLSMLAKISGEFSYERMMSVFIVIAIVYVVLCYLFMRMWLKSVTAAVIGILLILALHLFGHEDASLIWQRPSMTFLRYVFDVVFFIFIYLHSSRQSTKYLFAAAVCAGASIFYLSDTGLYLLMSFYAYVMCMAFLFFVKRAVPIRSKKDVGITLVNMLVPLGIFFICAGIFTRGGVFSSVFWYNARETMQFALHGFGAVPMIAMLHDKLLANYFFSIGIIFLYVFVIIFVGTLLVLDKIKYPVEVDRLTK